MQESIYNIIPKQFNPPSKGPIYKSKHPHNTPPTGSTFGLHTTSKPIGANLNGDLSYGLQSHTQYGSSKTLGHLKGDRKPSPNKFLKKHTGTMGNESLPEVRKFHYDQKHIKDPVPKVHDKPVHGLKSNKNFIVSNAVENILSTKKQLPQQVQWTKKKDYGRVPEYLQKTKENITNEYKMIQTLHNQNKKETPYLSQQQVNSLKDGLKRKWNEINHQYQKLTHVRTVDTVGLKSRKQGYQKQLAQIEKDIKKLNKAYVFVQE